MSGQLGEPQTWPDTIQMLTRRLLAENLPSQVQSCRTPDEKVEKVLNNIHVNKKISAWLSSCSEAKYAKNGAMSDKIREQGNVKFGAGDNHGAMKLYTESVICAPAGPGLGLALGNRSAALYHLGQHAAAGQDILLALQHKYPRHLQYKLHLRQAQCLIRLGNYAGVGEELDKCRDSLEHAKLQENKKVSVIKDISALNNEVIRLKKKQKQESFDKKKDPKRDFTENKNIPGASSKLRLEKSNDKVRARYLSACEDIETGEILFSESPFSCVLLPPFYSTNCHHCLIKLQAPVSCLVCTQPRYCSGSCRDAAWSQYHKYECGHLDTLHSVGIGHLAFRTILMAGRDHLLSVRNSIKTGGYQVTSSDPYSSVFNLQHHLERCPPEDQFQYSLTAALLVTAIVKNTSFLHPEREIQGLPGKLKPLPTGYEQPDDDVHFIGGLLLRHIVQLVSNAHAVTEILEHEDGSTEQVRLATGIYPAVSLMNHSCIPMIINNFTGSSLIVRCIRGVAKGQEVTNCYGPHYRRHEYQDRQKMLKDQYSFVCRCEACADPKDRQYLQIFTAFKCDSCVGAVVENKCLQCGLSNQSEKTISTPIQNLETSDLKTLKKIEKHLSSILYQHHEILASVRDRIAQICVDKGEFKDALNMLEFSVKYTRARYGENSIEVGHELLKFSDVLIIFLQSTCDMKRKSQLCDILQEALKIFKLQNGSDSKICVELTEKLSLL